MKTITCRYCAKKHQSSNLKRLCGNCFACTGCEIYQCPACGKSIVVTPMREPDI